VNPDVKVPPALEQVVMKCLAKKPEDRPQTPREVAELFHEALGSALTLRPKKTSGLTELSLADTRTLSFPVRRRIAGGVAVAALALAVVLFAFLGRSQWSSWGISSTLTKKPASASGKPAKPGTVVVKPLSPAEQRAVLARLKIHWAQQGFKLEADGPNTDGWPNTLIGPGNVPFHRTSAGNYLPEGYTPSEKIVSNGYPQKLTRDGKTFIWISGDQFKMGCLDEKIVPADDPSRPAHLVGLSGFYIQETEVTNGEMESYLRSAGDNLCEDWRSRFLKRSTDDGDDFARNLPAICISWNIASAYAEKRGGKLPTEAEWEFAARSRGKDYTYVWDCKGIRADRISNRVNINDPSGRTGKVASYDYDVTMQGVHDMAGNVREWCRDVWKRYAPGNGDQPVVDPEFPFDPDPSHAENNRMVIRGAAFIDPINRGRTTQREDHQPPDFEEPSTGFRIVIECPESTPPPR
jgi:formylglycine-generating enzyme required for sulfatase activity